MLTGTTVLTLLTFGRLLLATLGAIIAFCTLCTGLALSGCFGRRRSCRRYLRGRLLSSFAIALGTFLTLGALTAVVAVVIASVAVIVIATITIVVTAVVAIATTFASRALGLVIVTLLAILLTALAALLAVITFLTLTTLLTGLTTTTLLTLVGLLLLRLSGSCGLGRSFLALLIVAVLLALAARLLTLEGLIIGALTK